MASPKRQNSDIFENILDLDPESTNCTESISPSSPFDTDTLSTSDTPPPTIPAASPFQDKFVVDPIFPCGRVHLWSGISGVGKTTQLLQIIASWRNGDPVFGCRSYPAPFCYVACAEPLVSVIDILKTLAIDYTDRFPIISAHDRDIASLTGAVEAALDRKPRPQVLFLDEISEFLTNDPNQLTTIRGFFAEAGRLIRKYKITIIATIGACKVKPGERYLSPRQRIAGSAGAGPRASTVIEHEAECPGDLDDSRRTLDIIMKGRPHIFLHTTLDATGRPVIAPSDIDNPSDFELLVLARGEGVIVPLSEIKGICDTLGIKHSAMYNNITKMINARKLEKVKEAIYRTLA